MAQSTDQQHIALQQTAGQEERKSHLANFCTRLTLLLVATIKYSDYITRWEQLVGTEAFDPKLYSESACLLQIGVSG